jgi:pyruvate/2-oxoglutarate/acetoin dehydrogenase E1 component
MLSNLFVGVPGIKVVAPSSAMQVKGLLKSAIRDPNPVIFIENKRLYPLRGDVPEGEYVLPLNRAVVTPGEHVTVLAYSAMVPVCLALKAALAPRGIDLEVVDLVSLQPLDRETIFASVRKTGRAVIVEEACVTGGVGAEVSALIAEHCLDVLEAPVKRVGAADVPIASSIDLEKHILPSADDVLRAVRDVLAW